MNYTDSSLFLANTFFTGFSVDRFYHYTVPAGALDGQKWQAFVHGSHVISLLLMILSPGMEGVPCSCA